MKSTLFLHGVCMLRECLYGECAHEQHVRRTLTLTHKITAYSVSGNVVRVRILICATRQKPCRKRVYLRMTGIILALHRRYHTTARTYWIAVSTQTSINYFWCHVLQRSCHQHTAIHDNKTDDKTALCSVIQVAKEFRKIN